MKTCGWHAMQVIDSTGRVLFQQPAAGTTLSPIDTLLAGEPSSFVDAVRHVAGGCTSRVHAWNVALACVQRLLT